MVGPKPVWASETLADGSDLCASPLGRAPRSGVKFLAVKQITALQSRVWAASLQGRKSALQNAIKFNTFKGDGPIR